VTAAKRALCLLFGTALLWMAEPTLTRAQDDSPRVERAKRKGKARKVAKPKVARRKRERSREVANQAAPAEEKGRAPVSIPSSAAAAQAAAANADSEIVKEGDTSVKVMKFTGLGIEGRLKSPQLVYFVQRVRAEFDRPELAHRSFMPELAESAAREPVR
jgi:hypothetical protein